MTTKRARTIKFTLLTVAVLLSTVLHTATAPAVDAAAPGALQFSSADYLTSESSGTVTLEIQRVGGSMGELTATIQTFDGTATIVDDYAGIPTPLTLTWSDGNTLPKTVTLPIKTDIVEEGPETFTMELVSANAGSPSTATVTITNVSPGKLQFSSADYVASESAGTVTLEIQRVGGSVGELTATIQTFDGTATIVDDYAGIPTPLTLTWSDGNTTPKTVTLPIKPDLLDEPDETFTMQLVSDNAGTPSTATVTILGTSAGNIEFVTDSYSVDEAAGTVTVDVIRVDGTAGLASAEIHTTDGTADHTDFVGIDLVAPHTLQWPDGDGSVKTVTIPILVDPAVEADETFTVNISSTTTAGLGTPSVATVTITEPAAPTPTPTPTATPSPAPTSTPTPGPTVTPGPAPTPTATPPPPPPSGGQIQFAAPGYTATETEGTVTVTLERVGGSAGEVTAWIGTAAGGASADKDYRSIPAFRPVVVTWSAGDTATKTVTIEIIDDGVIEADESFLVQLLNLDGADFGVIDETTIVITSTPVDKDESKTATRRVDRKSIPTDVRPAASEAPTITEGAADQVVVSVTPSPAADNGVSTIGVAVALALVAAIVAVVAYQRTTARRFNF